MPPGPCRVRVLGEFEMNDPRRGNSVHQRQSVQIIAQAREEPLAAAKQHRHQVELHLVHQAGRQILLGGLRAPAKGDCVP